MTDPITQLILHEARLLDKGLLDDWLALYAKDACYWIPMSDGADPLQDSSIIYDDHSRLTLRVEQLMRQNRIAQNPASETLRMISNISIDKMDDNAAKATYSLLAIETRSGDWRQRGLGELRFFPAHSEIECINSAAGWLIQKKVVRLLNRKQPIEGLSFII